jgi:two-component system response regulator VanR
MADRILVVDDEPEIADLVELYLRNENFIVYKFYSASEALACINSEQLDLAILDVMLPGISGLQICSKIRERYNYPVIMLTAKNEEIDKITGLTLGADDYITKPFLPLELLARVKAQLRRYKRYNAAEAEEAVDDDIIVLSGLVLNSRTHECTLNERPLALTPTEFSLLRILCRQRGNVVSSEELLHQLWGEEYYSKSNNTVTVHIRHLREKMGDSFENPKYIKTVWGVGYKIEG